jgi:hypothetical protein
MNRPFLERSSFQAPSQSFGSSRSVLVPATVMLFAISALGLKFGVVMALLERLSTSLTSSL